jgi:alanyl-tRNA synthetase
MSQHTGQHMLSRALLDVAGAETVSSRLGATASTIDLRGDRLTDADLARAEDLVNDAVLDDRPVHALFPTADELAKLPLRRDPKVDREVRVIQVEGFDFSPCGGTHCTRTGQVGPVRITGVERHKGGWRVTFLAGRRAILDHRAKDGVLAELARSFTCGPLDVGVAVAKLRADLKARADQLAAARGELVAQLAERALAARAPDPSGTTPIVVARVGDDVETLRALAARLAARPDVVALVASRERAGGDWLVVVERGAGASLDAGAWMKRVAAAHGGRGGGKAERAEGRLPAVVDFASVAGAA